MADIKEVIDKLLKEPITHYLGDSGGAYGYQYERNQNEGYLKGLNPVEEWTDDDTNERTLEITIPVYDYLTYNLIKDSITCGIEEQLFDELKEAEIDPYSIYEVEDFLNNGKTSFYVEPCFHQNEISYVNTYNYEEYLSQTLLYCTFSTGNEDYLLLELHNGCDVRSGYTKPQLFKIKDIEYFLISQSDRFCQCECGLNDYTISGSDDPTERNGDYIDGNEIWKRTYVDNDRNVRCKKCNSIVEGGFLEW